MKPASDDNWYHEKSQVQYHENVFSPDPFVRATIAKSRAHKLQPLIRPDDKVLEYGVGIGLNLRDIRCAERTGYDLSGYGREACENAGIEFSNDLADIRERRFSAIICHHVLEHVPHPLETLQLIRELLEPGGRFILVVPMELGRNFMRYDPQDIHRHIYAWNPKTLGNLLDEAGFTPNSVELGPSGYEQRLAPLAKMGFGAYRFGLAAVRLVLPYKEIVAIAEPR